jgi:hypothetical protein
MQGKLLLSNRDLERLYIKHLSKDSKTASIEKSVHELDSSLCLDPIKAVVIHRTVSLAV